MLARVTTGHPLTMLHEEMDHLFDTFFGDHPQRWGTRSPWTEQRFPTLNLWESDEGLFVEAELPGARMGDLEITVLGNELTLQGERKDPTPEGAVRHRAERGFGTFSRTVHLPIEIDPDRVSANLKDGVLTIELPKAESAKPRRIEVKVVS